MLKSLQRFGSRVAFCVLAIGCCRVPCSSKTGEKPPEQQGNVTDPQIPPAVANVPYFSGPGGVTPPGGNAGSPGSFVPGWSPDLRKFERRFTIAILVKL